MGMRIGDKVCFFSTTYVKEIKRLFKEADTDGSGSPDLRALRAIFFQLVNSQVVPQCKLEVNLEKLFLVTESFCCQVWTGESFYPGSSMEQH